MTEFGGMKVIESPLLVVDGDPIVVRRSWRERLFSRPWRPFKPTRVVVPKIPRPGALQLNRHTLVMHPAEFAKLRALTRG